MSDASERPERDPSAEVPPSDEVPPTDPDAWADACAEDLAAEEARRRAKYGPPPGSAAEELRRLAEAVGDRFAEFSRPLFGAAGSAAVEGVAREFARQARESVEPVLRRNPEVFDHLAAAGGELLAAYRSAVGEAERRWTERAAEQPPGADTFAEEERSGAESERVDLDDAQDAENGTGAAPPQDAPPHQRPSQRPEEGTD